MKVLSFIIAAALGAWSAVSGTTVEITSEGKTQSLTDARQEAVKFWLQELMLSAVYHDVVQSSSAEEWDRGLHSESKIDCHYTAVVTLAMPERPEVSFDEVLLPMPSDHYPDYIYVKRGREFRRLAKYDPWVLHKLTIEAGVALYPLLNSVERGLF